MPSHRAGHLRKVRKEPVSGGTGVCAQGSGPLHARGLAGRLSGGPDSGGTSPVTLTGGFALFLFVSRLSVFVPLVVQIEWGLSGLTVHTHPHLVSGGRDLAVGPGAPEPRPRKIGVSRSARSEEPRGVFENGGALFTTCSRPRVKTGGAEQVAHIHLPPQSHLPSSAVHPWDSLHVGDQRAHVATSHLKAGGRPQLSQPTPEARAQGGGRHALQPGPGPRGHCPSDSPRFCP